MYEFDGIGYLRLAQSAGRDIDCPLPIAGQASIALRLSSPSAR